MCFESLRLPAAIFSIGINGADIASWFWGFDVPPTKTTRFVCFLVGFFFFFFFFLVDVWIPKGPGETSYIIKQKRYILSSILRNKKKSTAQRSKFTSHGPKAHSRRVRRQSAQRSTTRKRGSKERKEKKRRARAAALVAATEELAEAVGRSAGVPLAVRYISKQFRRGSKTPEIPEGGHSRLQTLKTRMRARILDASCVDLRMRARTLDASCVDLRWFCGFG